MFFFNLLEANIIGMNIRSFIVVAVVIGIVLYSIFKKSG